MGVREWIVSLIKKQTDKKKHELAKTNWQIARLESKLNKARQQGN